MGLITPDVATMIRDAETIAARGEHGVEAARINAQILRLDRNNFDALTRLGECYLRAGREEEAESLFRRALGIQPGNIAANRGAETAVRRHRYRQIAARYRSASEAFQRGRAARLNGDTELALMLLERAYQADPRPAHAATLAEMYADDSRSDEAEELYRHTLRQCFQRDAAIGLAVLLRRRGADDDAAALERQVDDHLRGSAQVHRRMPWERG